jgi:ribosomal protein S18 acetylase RimI-like enzyme
LFFRARERERPPGENTRALSPHQTSPFFSHTLTRNNSYFLRNWPNLCFLAFDRAVPPAPGAAAARALPLRAQQQQQAEGGPTATTTTASTDGACIGVVVAKQGPHGAGAVSRGYIAMLVVAVSYRGRRIGAELASAAVGAAAGGGGE